MLYSLIRKAIFSLDAENAHDLTIKLLKIVGNSPLNPIKMEGQLTALVLWALVLLKSER